ncbi:formate/nitrite transporter family protein [Agarivorans sp. B2Z047]|uniref:formate/nitrite transporter family protein n=1 Tax=Agarivorans sp. B2Z047 TaxID=2652721 RepID=UPI00128C9B14|nr:formate/nitrite transporter family protein [Agarivorans sp. B2Z047]MPW30370.1 formate/nitrite transporter family protein [Agarivorans sp. B2Z047]UQN43001.1 formate/nitrite transporter family protein [Agarivorans sp. B2Z047]
MSYVKPAEFVQTMIDAGESKVFMSTRDTIVRGIMAGAILAIAVAVAITAAVQTGMPIVGALVFPVGFCILNLMGFDLLTGVFALAPLSLFEKREGVTAKGVLRNWLLVGLGNLIGAVSVAFLVALTFTMNFSVEPGAVGQAFVKASTARTLGFAEHGLNGWITVFVKGILCNWMVCLGVVGAMTSKTVGGKVLAMWFPIFIFFGLVFEHAVVNMYLFPLGMMLGAEFTITDWLVWNQIPVTLGNLVGGLLVTGLSLYVTHGKTLPQRKAA